ncbi:MAG: hypothetical protein ACE5F7_01750 [Nitrospiria bacterium]
MQRFFNRVIRVLQLDPTVYSEIGNDPAALRQSMILVGLSSLSTGIGNSGGYSEKIPILSFTALFAWGAWALLVYLIGVKFFPAPERKANMEAILRVMGFAFTPGLFKLLGFLPAFSFIVLFGATFWVLGGTVLATRQICRNHSMARVILINVFGWACYQWILFQT